MHHAYVLVIGGLVGLVVVTFVLTELLPAFIARRRHRNHVSGLRAHDLRKHDEGQA